MSSSSPCASSCSTAASAWIDSSSLHGHHKAAIALNNTAVSLLVRGYSRYAMETFNDAMKFMRMVTVQSDVNNGSSDPKNLNVTERMEEDVQRALDRASKRFALCCSSSSRHHPHLLSPHMPVLHVVSTLYNPSSIYEALAACAQCVALPMAFPMTIDTIDYEACDECEIGFHAGVVLYNYGIAHDCMAATTPTTPPLNHSTSAAHLQSIIQNKAYRIFQLASALLSKIEDTSDGGYSPSYLGSRILLLQTFLTHNLIQASIKLNLQGEYTEYCNAMESLLQMLGMQQVLLPIADHKIAAAA